MTKQISPGKIHDRVIRSLRASADPVRAAHNRRYFKHDEVIHSHGQSLPVVRELARKILGEVRGAWGIGEALGFCDLMMADRYLEPKLVGMFVLGGYRSQFDKSVFRSAEGWLAGDLCNNWALTDALCSVVISPMVLKDVAVAGRLKGWTTRRNLWLRRASAVSLTAAARRGLYLDEAYEIAGKLMKYPEDLIHKANGWMLRDAGRTDPGRLERFLREHGKSMPRTTLRYAIEKFPEAKRRELLGIRA